MRVCAICRSKNRIDIDKMIIEGKMTAEDIIKECKERFNEEYSPTQIKLHKKNHIQELLDAERKNDRERRYMLAKLLADDIEIATKIHDHMRFIEAQLFTYRGRELSPEEARTAVEWLNQARLSIEQLLKWREKLMPDQLTIEDVAQKLMDIVADFPPEYLEIYVDRLKRVIRELKGESSSDN